MEQINKRFVFLNPHTTWFKTNIKCFLAGTRSISKYDYLFDHFFSKDKIYVIIDDPFENKIFNGILNFLNSKKVYFKLWLLLNRFPFSKFKILDFENLTEKDFLFSFYYETLTFNILNEITKKKIKNLSFKIGKCNAKKIFHFTHYAYNTKFGSQNLKIAKPYLLIAENNLKKNSIFFNKYFKLNSKFYNLPFVFANKFKRFKKFSERENKVYAFGTITHEMDDENFINFFKTKNLQPGRNMIYDYRKKIKNFLECNINNELREGEWNKKINKRNLIKFIISDFYKIYKILKPQNDQKKIIKNDVNYFKFDIVSQLNSYKMFICPEEICDLPTIGFVEGMACGSAFIGKKDKMYDDLGLIHNKNYIAYDGTLKDFENKVQFYLNNPKKLKLIADNGYKHAIENFNSEKVTQNFINYLNIKT